MSASADPCPSPSAIGDQWYSYEGVDSAKSIDNSSDTTTYTFWSTEDRDSTNGIPGLIELCVYTSPTPSSQDPTPSDWKDAQGGTGYFGFVRKTGQDNIHFDGDVHEIGVATWNANPPQNQTILLHIIDSVACGQSGQTVNTCWVYPWSDQEHRRTPPPTCMDYSGAKFEDVDGDGELDQGDHRLAGWTIDLFLDGELENSTTTDIDGNYLIGVCGDGEVEIFEETLDGWVSTGPSSFFFESNDDDQDSLFFLNFHLYSISGHKYNDGNGDGSAADATGIAGWKITVCPGVGTDTCTTTATDSSGFWSMGPLGPGAHTVTEEDKSGWTHTSSATLGFDGTSGTNVDGLDFLNFENIDVMACKWDDQTGNGLSNDDPALSGVVMVLRDLSTGVALAVGVTDSTGCTTFTNLDPGNYLVEEVVPDGWVATSDTSYAFGATSGNDRNFDFTNFELFSISGTKYEDMNGDGSTAGDSGIEGWGVALWMGSTLVATTTTGPDGSFSFEDLGPGTYTVIEETRTGWVAIGAVSYGAEGLSGSDVVGVDFANFELFSISGAKYEDMNGDGSTAGDSGIVGWGVELWQDGDLIASTTTGAGGSYSFGNLGPGTYTVMEETRSGWVATTVTSHSATGASGTDVSSLDFANFELFSISGAKYEDMNGDGSTSGDSGIVGWGVELWMGSTLVASTTTGAGGSYSFGNLGPGTYTVKEETRSGWVATTVTSHSVAGASGTDVTGQNFANFELGQICGIKFLDQNHDGQFALGVEVGIEGITMQLWQGSTLVATTTTGGNGDYCFVDLTAGTYTVKEVLPDSSDSNMVWAQTAPSSGYYTYTVTSGFVVDDANFGNVCEYTAGLTWGYWKTHTGEQKNGPAKDAAYNLLANHSFQLDIKTSDGDYLLENAKEAYAILKNAPNSCSGVCRDLFRAQLIALYMNTLKYSDMADQTYVYSGDGWSGSTVGSILSTFQDYLLNKPSTYDFTSLQVTLDHINNNSHLDDGSHVIVCTHA